MTKLEEGNSLIAPSFERITPAIAKKLLEGNKRNRPIRRSRVLHFIETIRRGAWQPYSNTFIAISPDGRLLDGQHRLHAIAEAGQTVIAGIMRGVPEETYPFIDTQDKKTAADLLHHFNVPNYLVVASIARLIFFYKQCGLTPGVKGSTKTASPGHDQIQEIADTDALVHEAASAGSRARQYGPPSHMGLLFYLCAEKHPTEAMEFWAEVVSPKELTRGKPAFALRQFLINARLRQRALPAKVLIATGIKCFNLWRAGKPMHTATWRENEDFPVVAA